MITVGNLSLCCSEASVYQISVDISVDGFRLPDLSRQKAGIAMTAWITASILLFIVLLACVFGPGLGLYGDRGEDPEE